MASCSCRPSLEWKHPRPRPAVQTAVAAAIAMTDVTAAERSRRAVVNLVGGSAVVGADEVAAPEATMILKPPRQQRKRLPRMRKLHQPLHGRRRQRQGPGRRGLIGCHRAQRQGADQGGGNEQRAQQGFHGAPFRAGRRTGAAHDAGCDFRVKDGHSTTGIFPAPTRRTKALESLVTTKPTIGSRLWPGLIQSSTWSGNACT
jgi:hypothetical protein